MEGLGLGKSRPASAKWEQWDCPLRDAIWSCGGSRGWRAIRLLPLHYMRRFHYIQTHGHFSLELFLSASAAWLPC